MARPAPSPLPPRRRLAAAPILALALVLVACGLIVAEAAKLPTGFLRCTKTDLRLKNDCLRAAVEDTLPKLKSGLPKLGLPPLDPLLIQELRISQGGQGPVSMTLSFKELATEGLMQDCKVLKAEMNLDNMTITSETLLPRAVATSNYTAGGRVLLVPIAGSGRSKIVLYDVASKWRMWGRRISKDGKDYMDVTNAEIVMVPKKMEMQLDNLFNGDEQLGKTTNRVLNDNWRLVYDEIGDSLNKAYAEVIRQHTRSLFQHVPLDNLFPDKL